MTSGGLYHLETTWLERSLYFLSLISLYSISFLEVSDLDCLPLGASGIAWDLERPKSQILTLHSASTRRLAGLMSLWMIFAVCMKFIEQSML